MTMTIKPDGQVFVYAPTGYPDHKINQRISTKKWRIERTKQRLWTKQFPKLEKEQCLLFWEVYTLVPVVAGNTQEFINTDDKTLAIPYTTKKEERLRSLAKTYLQKKFLLRVAHHWSVVNKLFIRSQTTKRGTCSSKKNIWLNWKLITLPEWIIDYIICHELAHLTHMNHSSRFREHCRTLYPRTNDAKKWLKAHGHIVG